MKETVLVSKHCQHLYDEDAKLLEQVWTNSSATMTTEDFKSVMLGYAGLYKEYDIKKVLVDSRFMRFTVVPAVQDWINTNVIVVIIPYLDKLAFLLSNDVFEEISIKQAIDDNEEDLTFETRYFNSEEKARQWLL